MTGFALKYPYFVIVCGLLSCVIGITSLVRMPVDLFPKIDIPVVVVATFYAGMPAEQIENDITGRFERFFTLGSGIEHIESKSLPGVSLIKIFFQPGTNPDSAVTTISNLAMANLRRLPPGTLPPVVLKFDASSLPVCLITLKAPGLSEATLRDMAQYNVRNQVANIPGASVPQPFGGRYRQIMVSVDPAKLEAHSLSVMDVVRAVNDSNLILPSGDVKVGPYDYNIFTNSQIDKISDINSVPLKVVGNSLVTVADIGNVTDGSAIQTSIVRVDGQNSAYLPVLKQGGDSNTISIVDGVKNAVAHLLDVPKELVTKVVFDQSIFVKNAIHNLLDEGMIGLVLTALMILLFLGSLRATAGVFLSIPLSVMITFFVLSMNGDSVNSMILGGLALAFSRLIDNSVVVLENIFRHLELGKLPRVAAEEGGREMALPVLAATLTTAIVFFPVTFLYGVSKYLFTALAISVSLALFASYVVALTVVPLFCARFLKGHNGKPILEPAISANHPNSVSFGKRFNQWFNKNFEAMLAIYDRYIAKALAHPWWTLGGMLGACALAFALMPWLDLSYFPRTDPGQFLINFKAPTGTRLEITEQEAKKIEDIIKRVVPKEELDVVVSNIGVTPGFSSIYTSNTASHAAFVQASLKEEHRVSSYTYMEKVRTAVRLELPELTTYFQTGGLVDAVLNLGLPAPIDIQVTGSNLKNDYKTAVAIAAKISQLPEVSDVYIPQDIDAPALKIEVDRQHASEMGLNQKEVVSNMITALTSDQMIAPSYWVDPKSGNDYMLTVQYPESTVKTLDDLKAIPLRSSIQQKPTRLDQVSSVTKIFSPSVVNHYQLRREIDIYISPQGEDLAVLGAKIDTILKNTSFPEGTNAQIRGSIAAMQASFKSFGFGLLLSVLLVYLILVAQFKSFIDPLIILLAVPPGLMGALLTLLVTGTTLNVMSLMGTVMMVGIVVSNSILIVEFTHRLLEQGNSLKEAVATACRIRLRPVLMTSLATVIGLIPMSLALGAGSEAYASLARVIIGGLTVSVLVTIFIVPAAFLLVYGRRSLQSLHVEEQIV
jgi:HAE1 family hydrophobic/amphiphilic exporter-1